jgi:hypothetical protein
MTRSIVRIYANLTRKEPRVSGGTTAKERFWAAYRDEVRDRFPPGILAEVDKYRQSEIRKVIETTDDDQLEIKIRKDFPGRLRQKLIQHLRLDYSADDDKTVKILLGRLVFTIERIGYSSIDIDLAIKNIDGIMKLFDITPSDIVDILGLYVPEAISDSLPVVIDYSKWEAHVQNVSLKAVPETNKARPSLLGGDQQMFWKVINAMWVLPIALALGVALFTFKELNERLKNIDQIRAQEYANLVERTEQYLDNTSKHFTNVIAALVRKIDDSGKPNCDGSPTAQTKK